MVIKVLHTLEIGEIKMILMVLKCAPQTVFVISLNFCIYITRFTASPHCWNMPLHS